MLRSCASNSSTRSRRSNCDRSSPATSRPANGCGSRKSRRTWAAGRSLSRGYERWALMWLTWAAMRALARRSAHWEFINASKRNWLTLHSPAQCRISFRATEPTIEPLNRSPQQRCRRTRAAWIDWEWVVDMGVDIKIPALGESITEGRIARWLKSDGAAVKADEPVFELETDKASTEIVAPADGVLHILAKEGETVRIGAIVARVEQSKVSGGRQLHVETTGQSARAPAGNGPKTPQGEKVLSPAARRIAEEEDIDTSTLVGTGRGGRVTKEDVRAAKTQVQLPATPTPNVPARESTAESSQAHRTSSDPPTETRERMTPIRKRIAERLVQYQQSTATLTTFNEVDMTAIIELRSRHKEAFQKKHGVGLGFMSFFVKAVVETLKAFPVINARIDGDDVVKQHFYNIGVAVSTEKGLMVPVIRDADRLGFADIEKAIANLAGKARDGKITVADLQGGTFTITNGGVFGSLLSTPILNPPQSAILGMHTIQKRPVAINDLITIRPMMYVALSYDHRLIDGREAVLFLARIKEYVESPERILLDV